MDTLFHFYRTGAEPFRSLSALPDLDAVQIMRGLYVEGSVFWERFKDPCDYLQMRRQTEEWLRSGFLDRGGDPQLPYPIYMVLGKSKWLLRALDAPAHADVAEIRVPLSIFSERDISFTYPDSMVSLMLSNQKDPGYFLPDFHGKIFLLHEILSLIESIGLPGEKWGTNLPTSLANYIEAQVWNRGPLEEFQKALQIEG